MLDKNKHKKILSKVLLKICSKSLLMRGLGFKGGTAAMLFYDLPRLSVDLDFDLLSRESEDNIFKLLKNILSKQGKLEEAIKKKNTLFFLLRYEKFYHGIKIEVSRRRTEAEFEKKLFLGTPLLVMNKPDMFACKLLALLTRKKMAGRDFFDLWYFLSNDWEINADLVKIRLGMDLEKAFLQVIKITDKLKPSFLLHGLGELVSEQQKSWMRTDFKKELITQIKLYLSACG